VSFYSFSFDLIHFEAYNPKLLSIDIFILRKGKR